MCAHCNLFAVTAGSSLPQPVLSIHRRIASPCQVPCPRALVAPADPQSEPKDLHQHFPFRRRQPPHRHPDHQPRHHECHPEMRLFRRCVIKRTFSGSVVLTTSPVVGLEHRVQARVRCLDQHWIFSHFWAQISLMLVLAFWVAFAPEQSAPRDRVCFIYTSSPSQPCFPG